MHFIRAILFTLILLSTACAIFPRSAVWSPQDDQITAEQVYDAVLLASNKAGLEIRHTDGSAKIATLAKNVGEGWIVLNVSVRTSTQGVQVLTQADYQGGVAIRGLHESYLRRLHGELVSALGLPPSAVESMIISVNK